MKADKKKLMKKLITIALMASMLTTDAIAYGGAILPSINASAFSNATIETGITASYDISTMEADEVSGIIEISISTSGIYKLSGSNYRADGDSYIPVQITIESGVTADLILDGLDILNPSEWDAGFTSLVHTKPIIVDGTANIYIKSDSSVKVVPYLSFYGDSIYSDSGTVNIIESENNAVFTLDSVVLNTLNVNGGNISAEELICSDSFTVTDGFIGVNNFVDVNTVTVDGGYCDFECSETITTSDGTAAYRSIISDLPANAQVTELNGKTLSHTYTDENGELITYLPDLTVTGFAVDVDGVLYICETTGGDSDSGFIYSAFKAIDIGTYNLSKVYDGMYEVGSAVEDGELVLAAGVTAAADLTGAVFTEKDAGNYTATVPFDVTYNGNVYTVELEVPYVITPATITVLSAAVADKTYDGTTDAEITEILIDGLAGTDILTLGSDYTVAGQFDTKDVGTGKTVTATVILSETVKNYIMEEGKNAVTATATISPASLTVEGATVLNKTYDGTTDATVSDVTISGVVDGETLTLGTDYTALAVFDTKEAGVAKKVTVTVSLAGAVKNYVFGTGRNVITTTADIIKVSGSVSNGKNKMTYTAVDPVSPLYPIEPVSVQNFETEILSNDYVIVEIPEEESGYSSLYFIYKVKRSVLGFYTKAGINLALSSDGNQTRYFETTDAFTSLTLQGNDFTPPEGYVYFVYGISKVPDTQEIYCSNKIELS